MTDKHIKQYLKRSTTDITISTASTTKTKKSSRRSKKHRKKHKHKKLKKEMSTYDVTEGALDDVVEMGLLSCMEVEP